ncbi:hypothetical protein [Paraburkholderia sediminicola]
MKLSSRWLGCVMFLALSHAQAQVTGGCVGAQQRAESDARIAAMTQNFDPSALGRNLTNAGQERSDALAVVQKCQSGAVLGMGCAREIDLYNLADESYKNAAQAIDVYRTLVSAQVNARAMQAPVCR